MQTLSWYVNRLRTMSPAEIAWRVAGAARDAGDRPRFALEWYPQRPDVSVQAPPAPFRITDVPVGAWARASAPCVSWRSALLHRADHLLAHRFTFFNLAEKDLGSPVDWNRDHESGRAAPTTFAPAIDYRDAAIAGDAKVVWEPNRHQHLVVLARAYRVTGEARYAHEVVAQIESWLDQSPFGRGMNWRSPLELAIRALNWVWALDLIRESGAWDGAVGHRIRHALYLHLWEIARKYSRGSSANNHVIGEAAGVFVATAYFPDLPHAAEWHRESRAILEREIFAQTYPDGGTREQATGYHLFVLQFYLAAGWIAERQGRAFGPAFRGRVERMFDFLLTLVEGGALPLIGDSDDGYVVDLGAGGADLRGLLSVGAFMFGRGDLARAAGEHGEWAYWLGHTAGGSWTPGPAPARLASKALDASGLYLLQSGTPGEDAVSVVIDCGELGYGPLAAHGHADALSVLLRINGEDVLVDPGTYDYFSHPEWRRYLRSTRAHNTLTIDGEDQSIMTGSFMWGRRARARCVSWTPSPDGGTFEGEHDGYTRLADPVMHRRRVTLADGPRVLRISDEIVAQGPHAIECRFHFAETCAVSTSGTGELVIATPSAVLRLTPDPRLRVNVVTGEEGPDGGWVSRGYHQKTPAPLVIASGTCEGSIVLETSIAIELVIDSRTPSPGRTLSTVAATARR